MNLVYETYSFIIIFCLLQGLVGLRLIKVSIPAYKLRGESTFLECQYELNKSRGAIGGIQTISRNTYNNNYYQSGTANTKDENVHKHVQQRLYPRQPYFAHLVQAYQGQLPGGSSGGTDSDNRIGGASSSMRPGTDKIYQPQYNYQQRIQPRGQFYYTQQYEQPEYQYTPPPSPYGHSIYRGRTQTSSTSLSKTSSSIYNKKYDGGSLDGTSSYTGKTYISSSGKIGSSSSFSYHPANGDDSNNDSNDRENEDDVYDNTNEDDDEGYENTSHEELEGEDLYAIKWYKDNEEFYRYVPKAKPPKISYRVDGIKVVEEHSDSTRVLLRGLSINTTGIYRCEISAEAPNFSSVQGEGRMVVVYIPRDGPHIRGQQEVYHIGELLNLNCTSGKSHPASHLQWFINGQPVVDEQYLVHYNDTVHRHGLITSTLGLVMTVDPQEFSNGPMHVKCLASISPVLWKGGKESIVQRRPGIIDNREAMLFVRSLSTSLHPHHCSEILNSLVQLRFLITIAIIMQLCQIKLLS